MMTTEVIDLDPAKFEINLIKWTMENGHAGLIPDYMMAGVIRYVLNGIKPGEFMQRVIQDRPLSDVVTKADDNNQKCLLAWHLLVKNVFPAVSQGSEAAMNHWIKSGGILGQEAAAKQKAAP